MREAVIVDAVRTPVGRRDGALKSWHPVDLLAHTLEALARRNKLDPAQIDDVIAGCVGQVGEQAFNIGRNAVLAAGFPESVPGTTVDRQCGSSQQAAHFAAQGVLAGTYDIAIACGVESMSRWDVTVGVPTIDGQNPDLRRQYPTVPQGISADLIASCGCDAGCPACTGPRLEPDVDARALALRLLAELGAPIAAAA